MEKIELGYEQFLALLMIKDLPDMEGSEIAKKADCSWDELFQLSEIGFIDLGMDRIKPNQVHPIITELGKQFIIKNE